MPSAMDFRLLPEAGFTGSTQARYFFRPSGGCAGVESMGWPSTWCVIVV
jgi:hypothetical protein